MWITPITQLLVLAAGAGAGSPSAAQGAPQPIATRQTEFGIPFTIEQTSDPARQPVQVQLYASSDQGKSWHLYGKVEPSRRSFVYQAHNDGEYWFRLCTLNRSGQLRPAPSGPPGLVVVVDTVPPTLQLEARRGDAGQITARWKIHERHPKPGTLTMQYRTTKDGPWKQVAIDREKLLAGGMAQAGEVAWWPQADSGQVQIRAELADAAGNPAVSHAIVDLTRDAGPAPAQTAGKGPLGPWRAAGSKDASTTPSARPPAGSGPSNPKPVGHLLTKGQPPNSQFANYPQQPSPGSQPSAVAAPGSLYPTTGLPAYDAGQAMADPAAAPLTANHNPATQNRYAPPTGPDGALPGNGLPPGVRPRMVNSKLVELAYDDRSLGPAGNTRVELWGTRNGGRTWRSFALDNDNRSPLMAAVDREGIYGFRVVVQSGVGSRLPQSGELPDVWIGVDVTKPTAQITGIGQGIGPESGKLVISWQADDWMLAARPVTLKYSESPGGPWTTLAPDLANSGRYAWPVDGRTSQSVYFRLEVVDQASNVGVFETTKPTPLDRLRPAVQIQSVRPLGQTSRTPGGQYPYR